MKKHYVTFYSPGNFLPEETTEEIESWDAKKASEMAMHIKERYDAVPFGFRFSTRERSASDSDSRETKRSGTYYLGGKILTIDDVIKRGDPKDKILISNMRTNKIDRVIENNNSWSFCGQFHDGDVLLELEGKQ